MSEAEDAIQNYMTYLRDPESLRDEDEIARLRKLAEDDSDWKAQWRAKTDLNSALKIDGTDIRATFVKHLKAYAEENNLDPVVLQEMGVPVKDLRDAGVLGGRSGTRNSSSGRRSRVGVEDVKAAIPASGTFTSKDLQESSGASYGTVRKVIEELLRVGEITAQGPDPGHLGRGRAPAVYRSIF